MLLSPLLLFLSQPSPVYVVDHGRIKPAEQVLAITLQGLTAKRENRIWMRTGGVQGQLLANLGKERDLVQASDVWELVEKFRSEINGAIVYDLGTPSLNVASGLCGPMRGIAVDSSLLPAARAKGLPILLDARGMTESDAFDRFRNRYKKGVVIEQALDKPGHLRDYAVKHNAFVMDAPDSSFRRKVVREFGPRPLVFGWGRSEDGWVGDLSREGGTGVPADWCMNLSFLESLPSGRLARPAPSASKVEARGRTIAFVMSDGDNVQWMTGGFATDPKFYGSPLRGKFPITWEVSALLGKLAPRVLETIYNSATPNDDFIAGPGLPGYTFPHFLPDRKGAAKDSAPYLRSTGLRTVSILNDNAGTMQDAFPWLDLPEVTAAIYKDYSPYHRRSGEVKWHRGKPCVAYRFVLWENLLGIDELVREIERMPTDPKIEGSYALINVHAWSYGSIGGPMEAVKRVIDRLPPNTRVVTASSLLEALPKRDHRIER